MAFNPPETIDFRGTVKVSPNGRYYADFPNGDPAPPVQISDLAASPGATSVVLTWTPTRPGTTLTIYRQDVTGSVARTPIATEVDGTGGVFVDLNVSAENEYNYDVTGTNIGGTSNPSNMVNTTTVVPLDGFLQDPDFNFFDDFTGAEDTSFWGGGPRHTYGADNPGGPGKCILFEVTAQEGINNGYNWTEKRFKLPSGDLMGATDTGENGGMVQVEISYDIWVSGSFEIQSGGASHQKFLILWGGPYGTGNVSAAINCEIFPTHKVSANWVRDQNNNFGHGQLESTTQFMPPANGTPYWMNVRFFITLGKESGEKGRIIMMKDGAVYYDTGDPSDWSSSYQNVWSSEPAFAETGNALRNGYLMGWQNIPYLADTSWAIRNFQIKGNFNHKNVNYDYIGGGS